MMVATGLGSWFSVTPFDPRLVGLYLRHYSSQKALGQHAGYHQRHSRYAHGVAGNGESLCLLTVNGDAGFIWRRDNVPRKDRQIGVNCTIFRNEGPRLSSGLIREADEMAWAKWPTEPRHWTYVADSQVKSVNPGYCFKKAGWTACGRNKDGRLTILEIASV